MPNPTESRLTELARAAREANALPAPQAEPDLGNTQPVEPAVFDDEMLLWALASSTCGGIDACLGTDAGA